MKYLLLLTLSFVSLSSFSVEWIGPFDVEEIEVHSSGVYFSRADKYVTSVSCSGYHWVKFPGETKLSDRALTIGLAASMANKKVKFYITHCEGQYLVADRILLPKRN